MKLLNIFKDMTSSFNQLEFKDENSLANNENIFTCIHDIIKIITDACNIILKFSESKKIKKASFWVTITGSILLLIQTIIHNTIKIKNIANNQSQVDKYIENARCKHDIYSDNAYTVKDHVIEIGLFKEKLIELYDVKEAFMVSFIGGKLKKLGGEEFKEDFFSDIFTIIIKVDVSSTLISESNIIIKFFGNKKIEFITYEWDSANYILNKVNSEIIKMLDEYVIEMEMSTNNRAIKYVLHKQLNVTYDYNKKVHDELKTVIDNSLEDNIRTGILICGPAGTGKTRAVNKMFNNIKNIIKIKISKEHLGNSLYMNLVEQLTCNKILFIDDLDIEEYQTKNSEVARLLSLIDSDSYNILIAIMNMNDIEETIIRSGRFHITILANIPDKKERTEILKILFPTHIELCMFQDLDKGYDFDTYVDMTDGMTHAELNDVKGAMLRYRIDILSAIQKIRKFKEIKNVHKVQQESEKVLYE